MARDRNDGATPGGSDSDRFHSARPDAAQPDSAQPDAVGTDVGPPPVPWLTLALMGLFVVGGSIGLTLDWPPGPANLDWGVWSMVYGGYAFVVVAALFYARTGK